LQQKSVFPLEGSATPAPHVSIGSTAIVGICGGGQAIPTDGYAQPGTA
jgi:hypothetical protein